MGPNSAVVTDPAFTFGGKHGSKESKKKKANPNNCDKTIFRPILKNMNNHKRAFAKEF